MEDDAIKIVQFMRRPRENAFSIERVFEDIRKALPADCEVAVWNCRNASRGILPRMRDIWYAKFQQGDVFHVTGDVHYVTLLLDFRRTVLTIHDLVSLERLSGLRRFVVWLIWYWLPVLRSSVVVTISETTRDMLIASVRCKPEKIVVVHNCVSEEFRARPKPFNSERPRILQIGTKPNKNLERVAEALSGVPCVFVIVGGLTPGQESVLARHGIETERHTNLSRGALAKLYESSDMLVFASTYEGFGLPIIEANAVGRPVVTGRTSSLPEVAGDAAFLVDAHDVSSIRAGISAIIRDETLRAKLVENGYKNALRYSPKQIAGEYARIYRDVSSRA